MKVVISDPRDTQFVAFRLIHVSPPRMIIEPLLKLDRGRSPGCGPDPRLCSNIIIVRSTGWGCAAPQTPCVRWILHVKREPVFYVKRGRLRSAVLFSNANAVLFMQC